MSVISCWHFEQHTTELIPECKYLLENITNDSFPPYAKSVREEGVKSPILNRMCKVKLEIVNVVAMVPKNYLIVK